MEEILLKYVYLVYYELYITFFWKKSLWIEMCSLSIVILVRIFLAKIPITIQQLKQHYKQIKFQAVRIEENLPTFDTFESLGLKKEILQGIYGLWISICNFYKIFNFLAF